MRDDLVSNRPLLIDTDGNMMVNTAGIKALQAKLPLVNLEPELDAKGEPTGRLGPPRRRILAGRIPLAI